MSNEKEFIEFTEVVKPTKEVTITNKDKVELPEVTTAKAANSTQVANNSTSVKSNAMSTNTNTKRNVTSKYYSTEDRFVGIFENGTHGAAEGFILFMQAFNTISQVGLKSIGLANNIVALAANLTSFLHWKPKQIMQFNKMLMNDWGFFKVGFGWLFIFSCLTGAVMLLVVTIQLIQSGQLIDTAKL